MLGTTHLLFSLFLGSFLFDYVQPSSLGSKIIFAALLLIGTFMPDLDLKIKSLKHRGILHTIWPILVIAIINALLIKFSIYTVIALAIGYGSHLIADALTPFGVAPLYPLYGKRIRGPVETGTITEFGVAAVIMALLLIRGI